MKLLYAPASPFARKVLLVVHELGLQQTVECVNPGAVTPVADNPTVDALNPLGMIPALQLDNGDVLYDSPVICEFLDTLTEASVYPAAGNSRFRALQLQALADGIMDLSVALRYETVLRPEVLRWQQWIDAQQHTVARCLTRLEQSASDFVDPPTIGELAVASALGYRDFRFPEIDWRRQRPALADWFAAMSQRPSLQATKPA